MEFQNFDQKVARNLVLLNFFSRGVPSVSPTIEFNFFTKSELSSRFLLISAIELTAPRIPWKSVPSPLKVWFVMVAILQKIVCIPELICDALLTAMIPQITAPKAKIPYATA